MPRLNRFSAQYPDIKIRVTSYAHFDDLKQQHIDLAIRFGTDDKENKKLWVNIHFFYVVFCFLKFLKILPHVWLYFYSHKYLRRWKNII